MWSPGVAALLTAFIFQRDLRGLGWERGPVRYLLVSYVLPSSFLLQSSTNVTGRYHHPSITCKDIAGQR